MSEEEKNDFLKIHSNGVAIINYLIIDLNELSFAFGKVGNTGLENVILTYVDSLRKSIQLLENSFDYLFNKWYETTQEGSINMLNMGLNMGIEVEKRLAIAAREIYNSIRPSLETEEEFIKRKVREWMIKE